MKHEEWIHLVFSSRRNVAVSPSQVSQNGIWVSHFGINARIHAITGFLAISFPYNPFQPSHFGTLSPIHYLPVHPLQRQAYQGFSRSRPRSIKRWHRLCYHPNDVCFSNGQALIGTCKRPCERRIERVATNSPRRWSANCNPFYLRGRLLLE